MQVDGKNELINDLFLTSERRGAQGRPTDAKNKPENRDGEAQKLPKRSEQLKKNDNKKLRAGPADKRKKGLVAKSSNPLPEIVRFGLFSPDKIYGLSLYEFQHRNRSIWVIFHR